MSALIEEIEKAFANSASGVRAERARAFQAAFVSMWGGIKFLIGSISGFVLLTLVMVTASTMSMAVRERFRELAILKALGFRRRDLFALILAESFGLAALGALLGAGGAWLLYSGMDVPKATHGIFVSFEVTLQIRAEAVEPPGWTNGATDSKPVLIAQLAFRGVFTLPGVPAGTVGPGLVV